MGRQSDKLQIFIIKFSHGLGNKRKHKYKKSKEICLPFSTHDRVALSCTTINSEFLVGSFVKNSLIVLTKVLLFSIPSITLPRIDCPYHKANQHNFIDGRAPLLTGGEADFGNRAPQINFCFGS